jgi:hypothetical protein
MARYLHVLNGDCTAEPLRASGLEGDLTVWADVLWSGRLPDTEDPEEWRRVRAGYLDGVSLASLEEAQATMRAWQAPLDRWREYQEIVFWLEHDLFDQLLLVRHLGWLANQRPESGRFSLICIDRFPGVEPFHGLGQLEAGQLLSLFPQRRPITGPQLALGRRAWQAFTAATPFHLQQLADTPSADLPFLAGAVQRYLEEYPAVGTGLSRTESTIMETLAQGSSSPERLFLAVQAREERVFMGDLSFLEILQGLASPEAQLIQLAVEPAQTALPPGMVTLTPLGRRVLASEVDRVPLTGIDRWHGGVHLHGRTVPWRWDPLQARIIATSR